jgi:tetratricopeptide (TPR) repeat protein
MSVDKRLFDIAVLDTNFFISLLNAGVLDTLLPKLQEIAGSVGITIIVPEELPKSDIPAKFRVLRQAIPKYIKLVRVNRGSNLWKKTARYAVQERMVRVRDDPADIDVVILAKKFTLKDNNKVALVSDDEGVARIVKENRVFKGIDHLSCGSFVSVLAAAVSDPQMRIILDQTVERVFRASWSYKKKTRRYIDVSMLINDLTDTARFVRSATESVIAEETTPVATSVPVKEVLAPVDALLVIQQLSIKARETRDSFNTKEAEKVLLEILAKSSELIYSIDGLEQRVIAERMLRSELFEHHSWLLDYKLTRNEIVEALVHAEACRVFMNFISIGKEAIENLISLQGLLYLLLGQYTQALDLFESILEDEVSPTQLLGLVVSLIAINQANEANLLLKKHPDLLDGMLSSMHTYANDLYSHDQRTLAVEILRFIVKNYGNREEVIRSIHRLFILTRLRQDLVELDLKVQKLFKEKLKEKANDSTRRGIPSNWMKELPIEISASENEVLAEQFKGFYHILDMKEDHERDEIHVIAWNESNNSTWNLVFDAAYKPALEESVKIKITSGTILKIQKSRKTDVFRGTVIFENPAIQPELIKAW